MGRTYAGAREDMSDVVGTSSSFSAEGGGAVYEGDGYHLRTGGDGGQGEGAAFQRCPCCNSADPGMRGIIVRMGK